MVSRRLVLQILPFSWRQSGGLIFGQDPQTKELNRAVAVVVMHCAIGGIAALVLALLVLLLVFTITAAIADDLDDDDRGLIAVFGRAGRCFHRFGRSARGVRGRRQRADIGRDDRGYPRRGAADLDV